MDDPEPSTVAQGQRVVEGGHAPLTKTLDAKGKRVGGSRPIANETASRSPLSPSTEKTLTAPIGAPLIRKVLASALEGALRTDWDTVQCRLVAECAALERDPGCAPPLV